MSEKLPVPIHYRKGLEAVGLYAVIISQARSRLHTVERFTLL